MAGPIASTRLGVVRGARYRGVDVYRGISYARPPVGELRFREPCPVRPWLGERSATQFGSAAPQSGPMRAPKYQDLDWLTLNVWTSFAPGSDAPVIVWIHGGAFMAGSASDSIHDGTALARSGVVVVTVNHRLGVEGYARIAGAPNNRGLLDQIAALEWVRDNIAAFGGDPHRVTVAGQSSGAGSVAELLHMPAAHGLFRRAIGQSVPGMYCTEPLAAEIAECLAARLSAEPTVAALASVDPQALADEADRLAADLPTRGARWGRITGIGAAFCPVVDDDTLPELPWSRDAASRAGIDLLVGHTRDEFRLFMGMLGAGQVTPDMVDRAIRLHVPGAGPVSAYRDAYPSRSHRDLFEIVHSDVLFRMPSVQLAEAHSRGGGSTFMYEFCWEASQNLGACHGADVPLLFDTTGSPTARPRSARWPSTEPRPSARPCATRGRNSRRTATRDGSRSPPTTPQRD